MTELDEQQLEELRRNLETLRSELGAQRQRGEANAAPVDVNLPIGRLTRMDALQQQHMARASQEGHGLRLREVAVALAAIDSGDYGYCRQCGEAIGFPRLKARPETRYCIHCQDNIESRGA
ncbi:MAG: DnaK suppressor protein [Gammaproteobacteria bacterium]|nr:MAG: DnaK suppressor protein [Gammaproteobacteria bacterium]TND05810.1 MAG: DnaK suppressor protein [Gammaproteobacteria bacterium]